MPDGGVTRIYEAADGARLRTVGWPDPPTAKGHILFAGGKRDFIERHSETYHRLLGAGYGLTALDWRDQGLSARGSVRDDRLFQMMAGDFRLIAKDVAALHPAPLILMAHSMGAHMMLRVLAEDADLRAATDRAILFAPMLGIAAPLPSWLMGMVAWSQTMVGNARGRPPGQPEYGPVYRSQARCDRLTTDRTRFDEGFSFIEAESGLAAGGASWGWLYGAYRSMVALTRPGVLEGVDTRILILLGSDERIVDPAAIRKAVRRLPHAKLHIITGGRHELQLESDKIQQQVWTAVDDFLS